METVFLIFQFESETQIGLAMKDIVDFNDPKTSYIINCLMS